MNRLYLTPKNNVTEELATSYTNFAKFIDKYKTGDNISQLTSLSINQNDELIIYSPNYFVEIYQEALNYFHKDNIQFYLFYKITTRSSDIAYYIYTIQKQSIHIQNKFHSLKQWYKNLFKRSETSKVRKSLEKFCIGNGIDIGFGGDPITPSAICVDLHAPYAQYKKNPLHLKGSGDNLYWFNNSVLDYVYSSHLLEDFVDTKIVLEEWLRVLKPSGKLVLFLPDEQRYRLDCERKGKLPNQNHIHDHFSLNYVKTLLVDRTDIKIIHEVPLSHTYSFELVIEKIT